MPQSQLPSTRMDPPPSSSFGIKFHHDNGPVASTPRTPKSKNANSYPTYSSPLPPFFCGNSPTIPLHNRSRNVAKIIKGQIHNVLTVMRSDPRYYTSGSRFEYEERHQFSRLGFWSGSESSSEANNSSYHMMRRLDGSSNDSLSTAMGSFAAHPILQGLRDLYDMLSSMESECYDRNADGDVNFPLDSKAFVSPFASAVCSPDVDAKTTGAALSALHKFIVYGFLEGNSSSEDVRESITIVAQCIQKCSFEETSQKTSSGGSKGSFWSSDTKNEQTRASPFMLTRPPRSPNSDGEEHTKTDKLPQFLLQPRRHKASKGNSSRKSVTLSSEDENVVLKLLSLSVQVLRCLAGRSFLSPSDVVGIFDRCLFVSIAAEEDKHALLRSAAADALSMIVVFGMRPGCRENSQVLNSRRRDSMSDDETADPTTEDASDSDDEWGEKDPSLDVEDSFLVKRLEKTDSALNNNETSQAQGRCESTKNQPNERDEKEAPALVSIMARLAAIADPLIHQDDTCVLSLTLINIALETMNDVDSLASKYPSLLSTLQNDLCQNLLRLSTSRDLTLLGLAMRVIFNLFNGIKHHMKLQLEVFLTSVHLRMLTSSSTHGQVWSTSPEYRELALESLLEFCREPSLMMDLYLNYDCGELYFHYGSVDYTIQK